MCTCAIRSHSVDALMLICAKNYFSEYFGRHIVYEYGGRIRCLSIAAVSTMEVLAKCFKLIIQIKYKKDLNRGLAALFGSQVDSEIIED